MECFCPFCERVTAHTVRTDGVATYAWCQVCFRVHVLQADTKVVNQVLRPPSPPPTS